LMQRTTTAWTPTRASFLCKFLVNISEYPVRTDKTDGFITKQTTVGLPSWSPVSK
jgi:hypothetical protein